MSSLDNVWNNSIIKEPGIRNASISLNQPLSTKMFFSKLCFSTIDWCNLGLSVKFWLKLDVDASHSPISILDVYTSITFNYIPEKNTLIGKCRNKEKNSSFKLFLRRKTWNYVYLFCGSKIYQSVPLLFINSIRQNLNLTKESTIIQTQKPVKLKIGDNIQNNEGILMDSLSLEDRYYGYAINNFYSKYKILLNQFVLHLS